MHASASPSSPSVLASASRQVYAEISRTSPNSSLEQAAVESAELLRGRKAVEIIHNGSVYRLQATRLGKLILTK
ncbi:hemin uptake protein HemP [Xylophilus sp. ASV27]|uniref:hemin uptake protein HemP n=1 Tax=Xylophilus sp. ASV27 TaxID=2795129 RepID=UPI0018EAE97C|nr:hemin uptake protein HemP [Xylophilus sp. ASV27]